MGSPDFALPTLLALNENFEVVGVVTQPDRPSGRGQKLQPPPVKQFAQTHDLPVFQPKNLDETEVIEKIKQMMPDVIVVAAYGKILKPVILNLAPFGCVNVHASLLPRWRGAAPVQAAILNDDISGVTIMKMDQGLDTGPILSQRSLPILKHMTAGILFDQLAEMGANLLVETLPNYVNGLINPQLQDESKATYAKRLNKSDGELNFTQSADYLARQVRAYNPWPGTFSYLDDTLIKVYQAHVVEYNSAVPGKRYIFENQPAWGTQKGLLVVDVMQIAGKAQVTGKEFINGFRNWLANQEEQKL